MPKLPSQVLVVLIMNFLASARIEASVSKKVTSNASAPGAPAPVLFSISSKAVSKKKGASKKGVPKKQETPVSNDIGAAGRNTSVFPRVAGSLVLHAKGAPARHRVGLRQFMQSISRFFATPLHCLFACFLFFQCRASLLHRNHLYSGNHEFQYRYGYPRPSPKQQFVDQPINPEQCQLTHHSRQHFPGRRAFSSNEVIHGSSQSDNFEGE